MKETRLAFRIADRYISIHEADEGYDYSIIDPDSYKELDGGLYDNPDISIREALDDIVDDLKNNGYAEIVRGGITCSDKLVPVDYDELMENVEIAESIFP